MEAMQQASEVTNKTNTMNDDRHTPAMPNLGEGEWLDPQTCKQWRDYSGLTKAEYAAIHTGQPCSGTPWLDEMIAKARRERLAGQALVGMDFAQAIEQAVDEGFEARQAGQFIATACLKVADALIAALGGGAK